MAGQAAASGIVLDGLKRIYQPRRQSPLTALEGVSFEVEPGEVVALLGPNGAGKTTCVRILATLLLPTAGKATLAGADVVSEAKLVRARCGVSFGGDLGLYTRISARHNLRYFSTMYKLDSKRIHARIERLLEQMGLATRADDRVENFSRGMRQRLHLARALLHEPPVLLLDEPSAGLDPHAARDLRSLVRELAAQGRAILLTTHDLGEAEAVSNRIVILRKGRILRQATASELRDEAAQRLGTCVTVSGFLQPHSDILSAVDDVIRWSEDGGDLRIYTHQPSQAVAAILGVAKGPETSVQIAKPTLEEAYLDLLD